MEKPIVLVIMDGVGKGDGGSGDAVAVAKTPTLDHLLATCPHTYLKAHGTAVGLPSDEDMGNSEVGHNALGCGQVYSQGAKLVGESIENGALYASETWKDLVANALSGKAMHFLGLLSDGTTTQLGLVALFSGITVVLTNFMSNNATMYSVIPVAITTSLAAGLNPIPVVLAVDVASKCASLLPCSSGEAAMCFGASGYTPKDTWKFVLPAAVITYVGTVAGSLLFFS